MEKSKLVRTVIFRSLRAIFRAIPLNESTRIRMRAWFIRTLGILAPSHQGLAPHDEGHATTRRPFDQAAHRAVTFQSRNVEPLPPTLPATIVAFYLPQFHPIPENDHWWGAGFTEWRNVGRALPQFEGQLQPRVPADLGYYDLRVPDVMRKQMQFAREYGVAAFCMYFYWFAGKTLLERPLRQWLDDPTLDLPLCLCWANENWSRRWDGLEDDILIGQEHSDEDDLAFIEYISVYLKDPRYLRVDGKPILLVYRPGLFADAAATAKRWREWCRNNGVGEIHLAYAQSFDRMPPEAIGFDAAVAFPPNQANLTPVTGQFRLINADYQGHIFDWRDLATKAMEAPDPSYRLYPCINPGWDNEARKSGKGFSFVRATPRAFSDWARSAISTARRRSPTAPLVFVNAWNEWAEGAILEPDARFGFAWLEALRRAMSPPMPRTSRPCAVIHVWYQELLEEIITVLRETGLSFRIILTVPTERESAVRREATRLGLDAEFVVSPNRGRDILPFLRLATRLLDEGEDVVLKLHTKRSTHRQDGSAWRSELLERLASPSRAHAVVRAFADDKMLGVVAPEGHVQPLSFYWGMNAANVAYLCALMGINQPKTEEDSFVAGSMFWCRLSALTSLIDAPLSEAEFESESGQVDGTMAHAVERVVSLSALQSGYRQTTVASLIGEPEPEGPYAYAKKA
ncbi:MULTISPECIES: glycoside hydrolase family 99-like domain-containing protein [Luteibacter]|uniref:glycoside hydrolase family 99-like domain-containing protein n=1 Tax=Luteibacter TaxID=242605 RepID=UPI000560D17E|nr:MULTISPECIES: glycoside hydrolase family 99-like domain-containing protein [unclassified Luteibacter]